MGKVVSLRIDEDLLKKVNAVAKSLRRSNNWVIREVLENYLEDLYDVEAAEQIIMDKSDEIVDHERAKKEIISN